MNAKATSSFPNPLPIRRITRLAAASAFFLILAARLHVIAWSATRLPFWDEWDGDLIPIFLPPVSGRPGLAALFAVHNEHRIVLTRLLDLALFWLQGRQFHVLTGMVINQIAFSAFGVALLLGLGRGMGVAARGALLVAGGAIWANPFGWQAITWSFESQIYFCIILSVGAFALIARASPARAAFWCGIGAACLSVLSFGAGMATVATAFVVVAARHLGGPARRRTCVALGLLAMVLAIAAWATPAGNDLHLTHGWLPMAATAFKVLAWPRSTHSPGFIYLPAICILARGLWNPVARSRFFWFATAILIWQAALAAQIAISRFDDPISSRYTELLIVGIVVNLACLLHLRVQPSGAQPSGAQPSGAQPSGARRVAWALFALIWTVCLASGYWHRLPGLGSDISAQRGNSLNDEINVARYLQTGDLAVLLPPATIPYHTPPKLAAELHAGVTSGIFSQALLAGDARKAGKWRKRFGRAAFGSAITGFSLLLLAGLASMAQRRRVQRP